MTGPAWLGATSGYAGQAGQVNQFLTAHAITWLYQGTQVAAQTTLGSGSVTTDGLWLAQQFSSGTATACGRVVLEVAVTGSPAPVTIGLYADASGPTGTALATTALPKEFASGSAAAVSIPLPVALTASTTYWIVASADGDAGDYFSWSKSNQTSGAMTAPDGVTWTAQSYGLYFQVLDQTATGAMTHTWEDSGARWTSYAYSSGWLSRVQEYTAGQSANGYTVGSRSLSYSGNFLTGVA